MNVYRNQTFPMDQVHILLSKFIVKVKQITTFLSSLRFKSSFKLILLSLSILLLYDVLLETYQSWNKVHLKSSNWLRGLQLYRTHSVLYCASYCAGLSSLNITLIKSSGCKTEPLEY